MSNVYIRFAARRFDAWQRSPLLERLVAGASTSARASDWRAEAYRLLAPEAKTMPPIAVAALSAVSAAAPPGPWCCIATPVHFSAGMSSVTMPEDGIVELRAEEAAALAEDFNRTFVGAGVWLRVARAAVLVCVFDRVLEVATHDPETVVGHDVFGYQPAGIDAPRLRRLMSEMEMWLFDHAVNRARASDARRPVTGLWLWGGGATSRTPAVIAAPPLAAVPTVQKAVPGWTGGHDPFFAAFGEETRFPREAGHGVVVCADQPGSDTWADVERRWLAPAADALRSGRIRRLDLSAAERRFSVGRGPNLRFWRRPRPWWESFDVRGSE